MPVHPLAGKLAPCDLLVNVPRLVAAYYTRRPDVHDPAERVAFGTSGHRGSSFTRSFNAAHIAAICQAISVHRQTRGVTGPLFLGMDTHALSEPAFVTAVNVFAARGVDVIGAGGPSATRRRPSPRGDPHLQPGPNERARGRRGDHPRRTAPRRTAGAVLIRRQSWRNPAYQTLAPATPRRRVPDSAVLLRSPI
jgi:hypothetical protein